MWTGNTMDFIQSLIVSGIGLMIVFSALIAMALAIMIVTKVFSVIGKDNKNISSENNSAANNSVEDEETFAVLMSVVSEEMHAPIDSFRIKGIKEIQE